MLSSRIEGTRADIADLYAYEAGQLPLPGMEAPPPQADVREVLNHVQALRYGLERLETLPVSLRLIRELHERLLGRVPAQPKLDRYARLHFERRDLCPPSRATDARGVGRAGKIPAQ